MSQESDTSAVEAPKLILTADGKWFRVERTIGIGDSNYIVGVPNRRFARASDTIVVPAGQVEARSPSEVGASPDDPVSERVFLYWNRPSVAGRHLDLDATEGSSADDVALLERTFAMSPSASHYWTERDRPTVNLIRAIGAVKGRKIKMPQPDAEAGTVSEHESSSTLGGDALKALMDEIDASVAKLDERVTATQALISETRERRQRLRRDISSLLKAR